MNPLAVLALIGDLYSQVQENLSRAEHAEQQVQIVREELAFAQSRITELELAADTARR
jgi:hypothetical protein